MATLKLTLRTQKLNNSGKAPLYLRITNNRKVQFLSLGIRLEPDQWDEEKQRVKRAHPNSNRINALLKLKVAEAQAAFLDKAVVEKGIRTKDIKAQLISYESPNFLDYAYNYIDGYLKTGKVRTFKRFRTSLNKLSEYLDKKDFTFDDLDVAFLKKYEAYLRNQLGNTTNTIHTDLKSFRRIINEAIEEELLPYDRNPFLRYKLKWEKTEKVYLTENELQAFESIQLTKGTKRAVHRDAFVFACYVGGLRISDIARLKWINFDGTHITISTLKTKNVVSIKVPQKALEILNQYQSEELTSTDFIFPILDRGEDYSDPILLQTKINSRNVYANKDLKYISKKLGIDKNISFHTSRHTWATRALRKGMRIEYVSRLMGHASIKTTQVYTKIVNNELDEAMGVFDD